MPSCCGWRIGRVPNGTVLAIVSALSQSLNYADPLSINAFYLEPTQLGEAEVEVEIFGLKEPSSCRHAFIKKATQRLCPTWFTPTSIGWWPDQFGHEAARGSALRVH